jgi:protein CMS1
MPTVVPKLATRISQKPKHNGAPTVFIISGNALRATDLARAIRPLKGERGGEITKVETMARIHFDGLSDIRYP